MTDKCKCNHSTTGEGKSSRRGDRVEASKENSLNTKGLRETCGEMWIELISYYYLTIENICVQCYGSKQ